MKWNDDFSMDMSQRTNRKHDELWNRFCFGQDDESFKMKKWDAFNKRWMIPFMDQWVKIEIAIKEQDDWEVYQTMDCENPVDYYHYGD